MEGKTEVKERLVTRRCIKSKTYEVYDFSGENMKLLDTITVSGRISEKELARKYKVERVVTRCIKEQKAVYGMPVNEFMKYAVEVNQ